MYGSNLLAEDSEGEIEVGLKRSVAKITLNDTNSWAGTEITTIKINSIPKSSIYYAYRDDEGDTSRILSSVTSTISYSQTTELIATEQTISCYVPVNTRGTVAAADTKPTYAPSGATYALIEVNPSEVYLTSDIEADQKLKYYFYLEVLTSLTIII